MQMHGSLELMVGIIELTLLLTVALGNSMQLTINALTDLISLKFGWDHRGRLT